MSKHIAFPIEHDTTAVMAYDDWFLAQLQTNHEAGYWVAYRILATRFDAEDVLQEASINAWEARKSFRGDESNFRGWFATVVYHAAINLVRKRNQVRSRESSADQLHGEEDANLLMLLTNGERTPDECLLAQESLQELVVAVRQLPRVYREVILLRYGENLTCKEVAARLRIGESAVKTRLYRAHQQLKEVGGMRDLLEAITRER